MVLKKNIAGIVAGSVIGGALLLGLAILAFHFLRRRRRALYTESKQTFSPIAFGIPDHPALLRACRQT